LPEVRRRRADRAEPVHAGRQPAAGYDITVGYEETLKVRIPVGAEDGTVLRVSGRGLPAEKPGTSPGDLFVVIRAATDPRFERRGSDPYRTETIDVVDAVLGARIDVPLLDGRQNVDVPAGAQPDAILRLVGKGLPSFGGGPPATSMCDFRFTCRSGSPTANVDCSNS